MNFLKEAFQDKHLMIDIRRKLHQIPEIGMDTFETANYIKERLREIDCQPIEIGNNGVAAVIGRDEGKTIFSFATPFIMLLLSIGFLSICFIHLSPL